MNKTFLECMGGNWIRLDTVKRFELREINKMYTFDFYISEKEAFCQNQRFQDKEKALDWLSMLLDK